MSIDVVLGLIPALSLFVSLVAVIVGPFVSLKISKRQLILPIRQKWIDDFRELMSVILSECQSVIVMTEGCGILSEEKGRQDLFQKLLYLEAKLGLMLDPYDDDHIELFNVIRKISESVHHGVGNLIEFGGNVDHSTRVTQKILKNECERIASA